MYRATHNHKNVLQNVIYVYDHPIQYRLPGECDTKCHIRIRIDMYGYADFD